MFSFMILIDPLNFMMMPIKYLILIIPSLLPTKNISEYFAVLTKLEVDNDLIWQYYNDIKKNVEILFPALGSLQIFENLYNKYLPKGNLIYDLEVVSIMLHYEIPFIGSFNIRDFQNIDEIELYEIE